MLPRPPHPMPYVRDDRDTPLWWGAMAHCRDDLPDGWSEISGCWICDVCSWGQNGRAAQARTRAMS